MPSLIKAAHLLVLISVLVVSSVAQSAPPGPPIREPDVRASTEVGGQDEVLTHEQRRALWLLDQLFEQAKSCDDETFRIRMQAEIADLVWRYDEPRAREQFEKALQAIDSMKPESSDDLPEPDVPREFGRQNQLRLEVLELLTHHDSEWARKLGTRMKIELSNDVDSIALQRDEPKQSGLREQTSAIGAVSQGTASAEPVGTGPPSKLSLMNRSFRSTNLEDLLNQAEVARSPVEKDGMYARAARQAILENDFERALSVTEKISSRPLRENLEAMARQRAAIAALNKGDFDAADHYVRDLPNLMQRARVYDQMLRAFQRRNDVGRAAEVLTEAEKSFAKAKDGQDKTLALLLIAGAAARIDPLRGFDFLELAIVAINHPGRDRTSDGADGTTDLDSDSLHFDQVLPLLARADLDRVLQLAQSIDNKEFSVLAQLAICRGLLAQLPQQNDS